MSMYDDKDRKARERASIATFFSGRSIFVTGSTGFLGKVLIEKLLRSCPGIQEIFLLLRPKKGLSIEERLKKMIELPLFDKIREQNPNNFKKLIPMPGDTSVEGLGLSETDRQTLIDRVSVVYHVAANVRFDEDLKKDVLSNTRSTRDICILAKSIKNLAVLVHVSTAFSQCDKRVVEEIVYPAPTDWRKTIEMVENLDEYTIRAITSKYIGTMPNTYTFSKRLAEQVVSDFSKELPCLIVRPSIVISSADEPMPGWIDNFNGPIGLLTAGGKGVIRVAIGNPNVVNDYLPVDVTIKAIVLATWKRGIKSLAVDPDVHVYNITSYMLHRLTVREITLMGLKSLKDMPLEGVIWHPYVRMPNNAILFYLLTVFSHILPSFFLDAILQLMGHKPILRRLYIKLYHASLRLKFFTEQEFEFINNRMLEMANQLTPAEQEIFGFNYQTFDKFDYYQKSILGVKMYLLKENLNVEAAKRHYNRMHWIDRIYRVLMIVLAFWIFWRVGCCAFLAAQFRYIMYGEFLNE